MTNKNKLMACFEALERLKDGTPQIEEFIGLKLDKITNSIVSQEAGNDKGYIKNGRPNHQGIIQAIKDVNDSIHICTLSKSEIERRNQKRIAKLKDTLAHTELLLEESLTRELLLVKRLKELEEQLSSENKIVSI